MPPRHNHRLTHWKAFRAFFSPGFLRSTILGSRVSSPAPLSSPRSSGSQFLKRLGVAVAHGLGLPRHAAALHRSHGRG